MASPSNRHPQPTSPSGADTPPGAPLDRVRQMLLVPPAIRPPEFENPLEKIEQLLTCPICLDRYKQPKLLPCHHTFCLPCLDNCVDIVHRVLKCPECRAEHPVPYDGVKAFQSNYTLTGFLDIHLQATDENAAQLEAYIQRYNLERCKVCDEKAVLDVCAHCDRRACNECRSTHLEMLKRDLNRMLNQVKRLSNRITEASDGLSKGAELLSLNCETAKDEVKEYFRRYYRELKKREEMFLEEIETFQVTETRLMRNLRDILEIESSNMSEGCAFLEAALKGEREVRDAELVKLKNVFAEGLEYLRSFQPDADELFSKKLRFSPGDDASRLPAAIASFGELTVMLPQFAGRYLPLEQSYLPRPMKIGYESDNYKYSSRRPDPEDNRTHNEIRGSGRYSVRSMNNNTNNDDEFMSIRYRRRQQMEEEAWNRLRAENTENHSNGTTMLGSGGRTPGNNPWSKTLAANGIGTPTDTGSEIRSNFNAPPTKVVECLQSQPSETNAEITSDNILDELLVAPKGIPLDECVPPKNQKMAETKLLRDNLLSVANSNAIQQQNHNVINTVSHIPIPGGQILNTEKAAIKVVKKPPLPRQLSGDDSLLNEKIENIRSAHEKRKTMDTKTGKQSRRQDSEEESECENEPIPSIQTGNRFRIICRSASDAKEAVIHQRSDPTPLSSAHEVLPEGSSLPIPIMHYPGELPAWLLRRRQRYQRSKTNPDLAGALSATPGQPPSLTSQDNLGYTTTQTPSSSRVQQLLLERCNDVGPSNSSLERRSRFRKRSSVVPGRESSSDARLGISSNTPVNLIQNPRFAWTIDYFSKGKPRLVFGKKGSKDGELNWPRGIAPIAGNEFAVCDSSNHRVCVFNTGGRLLRVFGKYGTGDGNLDSAAGICCGRYKHLIVSDRYNHRIMIFDQNGQFLKKFGSHGPSNGRFNNPWGVAVDDMGMVYVVDKDNHRVQIFDLKGQFVGKFGTMGPGLGQLHHPQFIAIHKRTQNIYVTDSSNHRVCVFDHNGNPIFHFGGEGYQNGQMKFPRGIAVDDQGFIIVADSGNNRVQIFYPDGRFMHSFGTWGTSAGQLKGVEAVAVVDSTIIVSDRENHRMQLF